jgi:hypothetical protein
VSAPSYKNFKGAIFMDKKENNTTENKMIVAIHPNLENLLFDMLYDRFISMTDTDQLIKNISTENLEAFLYRTARFFYGSRTPKRGNTK